MYVEQEYGVAATLLFPLIDRGTLDFEKTPVTFAAGDTQISKNEGAFANAGSSPVHEGNGMYSLALTATEMQAARIMITCVDATATKLWEDQAVIIHTYGNASAQHAFNRNSGVVPAVDVTQVNGSTTITLPGQVAPPLAPTPAQLLGWLYKVFRNRKTQTATQWSLMADDETTVDAKAVVSDNGSLATKEEVITGP